MKSCLSLVNKKPTAGFRIVGLVLAIAQLWVMPVATNSSVYAQTSDDVSNSTAAASSPADWIEFLRDNMQRWNPYETVLSVNNVGGLQLKWKTPISVCCGGIPSSPAVVNGVLYVGSDDHNVYALNASTGAKLWNFTTRNIVQSSPAVVNGVVYVGSYDDNVYALNASTGAKLWSYMADNAVVGSPTVLNGVVYIGSIDTQYALNASTGTKLWSFKAGGNASPAVANGVVYVGSNDDNVYALNASTGVKLWSYATGDTVISSPVVANGVVYVGSLDRNVYALDANTGTKLWSYATGNFVTSSPAVANGVVYVGSFDHNVYALSASTGAKQWSYTTVADLFSSPAVANGVVYFGFSSSTGTTIASIYALDASTGTKLWNFDTLGAPQSPPTIVNGVVYFQSLGNVYAFSVGADLFLRIFPSTTTVHQGDLITYAFPVWNLGPANADFEVLNTQVPAGTTFDYVRISGTPGLGTCTHPPYGGTGQIVCHEGDGMAPNTTWTVRLTVKVTAPSGTVITANAATLADTPDPNMANNMATVSVKVQ